MVLWLVCLILGSSIFLIRCCPDTPLGVALRRHLAVGSARWLLERKRSDLFYFLIIAGFSAAGGEVFAVLGPEVVLAFAADLALYLDLVLVSSMVAAASRLKVARETARGYVSSIKARASEAFHRNGREPKPRKRDANPSDNDDEDSWRGLRLAA